MSGKSGVVVTVVGVGTRLESTANCLSAVAEGAELPYRIESRSLENANDIADSHYEKLVAVYDPKHHHHFVRANADCKALVGPVASDTLFHLSKLGFDHYLRSESDAERAAVFLSAAKPTHERLVDIGSSIVGDLDVVSAQRELRLAMTKEALVRTEGNRHAAARILGVDRRYIVRMIHDYPELEYREAPRSPRGQRPVR